jgi:hypothetical protein
MSIEPQRRRERREEETNRQVRQVRQGRGEGVLSVFICVHLWLFYLYPAACKSNNLA